MNVNESRPNDWLSPRGLSNSLRNAALVSILIVWPRAFLLAPLGKADMHFTDGRFSASLPELGLMAFSLILCAAAAGMWFGVRARR